MQIAQGTVKEHLDSKGTGLGKSRAIDACVENCIIQG